MKTKDFTKLGKELLPHLPGFVVKGKEVFKSPVDDFLRGVYFVSSVDANCFYFSVFFLPLFVPAESIHGTYSKRIGHALNWRTENPNLLADLNAAIDHEAIPFLNKVSTLADALDFLKEKIEIGRPRVNSHILEGLAYTLIKAGDYQSALKALAEQKILLANDPIPWMQAQLSRTEVMEEKLLQDPEAALNQLEVWKAETVNKLGLEKYC